MRHVPAIGILTMAVVSVFALLLFANADGVPYRLIPWDFRSLCGPWLTYGWDMIRAGMWPLWCPYAGGGVPFFINPQTALYSPLIILVGLLFGYSYHVAQVLTVAMLLVGGVGAYVLAHSIWRNRAAAVVTGICFELSSALFCHMEHLSIITSAALAPWIFWSIFLAVERRNPWGLPLLAWFVYWLATAGYIGIIFMILPWSAALTLALLVRKPGTIASRARILRGILAACLLGGVMSAVTWLPFVMNTGEFTRGKPLSVDTALSPTLSFAVKDTWGILWSFLTEHPLPGSDLDISMRGLYFGAVAVALAAVCLILARGWIVAALAAFALGTLLMTFGTYFFGRVLLHLVFPVLNLSRLPAADNRGMFVLALSLAAGGGAALLARGDEPARRLASKACAYLLVFYVVSLFGLPWIYGKSLEAPSSTVTFEVICMLLALLTLHRLRGKYAVLMLAGIVWLETGFCATKNYEPIGHPISVGEYLRISRHVDQFTLAGVNSPRLGDGANPVDQSSAEAFMAKRFHINDYNPLRLWRFNQLIDAGFLPWMQSGPRVAALPLGTDPKTFEEFRPHASEVNYSILEFIPNRVRYRVHLNEAARLVFNEIYFPGWHAEIDGKPETVVPLAEGLRSLRVASGSHEIVFTFRPKIYFLGLGISVVGFVLLGLWVIRLRRRGRLVPDHDCDNPVFVAPLRGGLAPE